MTPRRRTRRTHRERALPAGPGVALALALTLAVACSGGGAGGGGGGPRPPGPGPGSAADAPAGGSGATAAAPAAPTERECDELIAHAVALRVAELGQKLPPEQVPTEAEQAALRAELRGAFLADCRGGTRRGYDCAITARSLADLGSCQRSPSSSTSNSSVAPGGIAPPAPRAP
jgi:hypothetical protein